MIAVKRDAAVSGNFELIKPNNDAEPLAVSVTAEDRPLWDSRAAPDGMFSFDVKDDGLLDLCVANGSKGDNDGVARTVGFAIRVTSQHTVIENDHGSLNELLEVAEQLNEGLLTLGDHQTYARQREETHRKTLASTKSRIYWWTVAETCFLVFLSVWQVFYIRQFFEIKRRV